MWKRFTKDFWSFYGIPLKFNRVEKIIFTILPILIVVFGILAFIDFSTDYLSVVLALCFSWTAMVTSNLAKQLKEIIKLEGKIEKIG